MTGLIAALAAAGMLAGAASAATPPAMDDAARFGMREGVTDISLSPGGTHVAFIAPTPGRGTQLMTVDLTGSRDAKVAATASGKPERLENCDWVSETRLVCTIYGVTEISGGMNGDFSRLIALDADGGNVKMLSLRENARSLGVAFGGGNVLDWLPGENGAVLLGRNYVPEEATGTRVSSQRSGYGVDRVDTLTLKSARIEPPKDNAVRYLSDGRGTVRIMGMIRPRNSGYETGVTNYFYRIKGAHEWTPLGDYNEGTREGFYPSAVDASCDCAYGFKKQNGRFALVRVALDAGKAEQAVFTRDDVDVDDLIRIGRARRVVGTSYATERREAVYFDPALQKLRDGLSKVLPKLPLVNFAGASADESKLLIWAGSDTDPGRYFVYDKPTHKLEEIMLVRPALEGATLAQVKPVTLRAKDGTPIPAYLTLPPGKAAKGLPGIVMPHGGPSSRDEWGFDWLAQYYAARGYAVLQPQYRGSSGYGDAWFRDKGFKSWKLAIGDVDDAGRWLVSEGIADPAKLAIVGWSYGGYAALQSGVLDPGLFKAIVAIAPVTDLAMLKEDHREFTDFRVVSDFVGAGPHVIEGSPAQNAARIVAPVLMFSGDKDLNVDIAQGREMERKLKGAGKPVELIVYEGLDHQIEDGAARRDMLAKSDAFLRKAMGL